MSVPTADKRLCRIALHFVEADGIQFEELSKPEHPLNIGLWRRQRETRATLFLPVEQHPEKAAGNVLHIPHVDGDRFAIFPIDQSERALTQQC